MRNAYKRLLKLKYGLCVLFQDKPEKKIKTCGLWDAFLWPCICAFTMELRQHHVKVCKEFHQHTWNDPSLHVDIHRQQEEGLKLRSLDQTAVSKVCSLQERRRCFILAFFSVGLCTTNSSPRVRLSAPSSTAPEAFWGTSIGAITWNVLRWQSWRRAC